MNFKPLRLSVVLLGDRLAIAALRGARVETFIVEAENPADALRAELEARGLSARNAFFALSRSVVTVKPIDLPPVAGDVRQMVGFELERHLAFSPENASYDFVPLPPDPTAERAGAVRREGPLADDAYLPHRGRRSHRRSGAGAGDGHRPAQPAERRRHRDCPRVVGGPVTRKSFADRGFVP